MSKVKFKKPRNKKVRTRKFGHIRTKNYDCFFLFFPLIPLALLLDWVNLKYYKSLKWSNRRADKVLSYYLPKAVEYSTEKDAFYLDANWYAYNFVPFGHHQWYQKFNDELDDYLLNEYCPEGYTKGIYKDEDEWYSPVIYFKKIEK